MQGYAENFDLLKDIVFNTTVRRVYRNPEDTSWLLDIESPAAKETRPFDKVVFAHGYQTQAHMPKFPGADQYTGSLTHSQEYRR